MKKIIFLTSICLFASGSLFCKEEVAQKELDKDVLVREENLDVRGPSRFEGRMRSGRDFGVQRRFDNRRLGRDGSRRLGRDGRSGQRLDRLDRVPGRFDGRMRGYRAPGQFDRGSLRRVAKRGMRLPVEIREIKEEWTRIRREESKKYRIALIKALKAHEVYDNKVYNEALAELGKLVGKEVKSVILPPKPEIFVTQEEPVAAVVAAPAVEVPEEMQAEEATEEFVVEEVEESAEE